MSFVESFAESFSSPNSHPTYKAFARSFNSSTTTTAYGVLVLIIAYYLLTYFEHTTLPLSELLWNCLVYMIPSRILSALDGDFGKSGSGGQEVGSGFDSRDHARKSNAMRRIMGFEGPGIMTVVQRTRTLSGLGSVFKGKPANSPPGLGNWDNSCYQNSVLQGLAALESLPGFLSRAGSENGAKSTASALMDVTARLNDPENVGKTFWTPAQLKSMSSWQQQDAQEYYSKVLDEVEKDIKRAMKWNPGGSGLRVLASPERTDEGNAQGLESRSEDECVARDEFSAGRILSRRVSKASRLPEELAAILAQHPLEGLLAQRVGCQQCGYVEGLSLIPFNCLTLPLGRQWTYDLLTCLGEYTALEPINGVECAKCTLLQAKKRMEHLLSDIIDKRDGNAEADALQATADLQVSIRERLKIVDQAVEKEDFSDNSLKKCQIPAKSRISTTKTRQAVIIRAPKALTIHVNRSIFNEMTGEQSKNYASVRFPRQLDLGPWCLGPRSESDRSPSEIESWNLLPTESMLSDAVETKVKNLGPVYELRSIITHYGRHENGHYICYKKSPPKKKAAEDIIDSEMSQSWWRLSDEDVSEVDEETVLSQGGVFMLFYEQSELLQQAPGLQSAAPEQEIISALKGDPGAITSEPEPKDTPAEEGLILVRKSEDPVAALPTSPAQSEISNPTSISPKHESRIRESAERPATNIPRGVSISPSTAKRTEPPPHSTTHSPSSFTSPSPANTFNANIKSTPTSLSTTSEITSNSPSRPRPSQVHERTINPCSGRGGAGDVIANGLVGTIPGFVSAN